MERAIDQAMDWMVLLSSGRATTNDQARFDAWLAASPTHESAWQRLQKGLATPLHAIATVDGRLPGREQAALRQMLRQPARRSALKSLLLLAGVGAGAWGTDRVVPLGTLASDMTTRTAQRKSFDLPDGSHLMLNARSAVDVRFDATHRQVSLRRGDVIAEVAPAAREAWPAFELLAGEVRVRTAQGRFVVSQLDAAVRIYALRDAVEVAWRGAAPRVLAPGEGVVMGEDGRASPVRGTTTGAEWESGYLSAAPLPLGEVVAALRRYTPGILRVSPAAARLPVHASLPLNDVPRALAALADTLPIRIERIGPWWATIDLATAA
ncbi:DUF4880 domain-containing protein [Pseudomonadota bacterium AL_CKDN230030165-1A_HGKHYDSX7]